jgi:hypothetical protein
VGKEYMPKRKSIIARRAFPSRANTLLFFLSTWMMGRNCSRAARLSRHHAWQHVNVKEQGLYLITIMLSCNHLVFYFFFWFLNTAMFMLEM